MKTESSNLDLLRSSAVLMVLGFHLCLLAGVKPPENSDLSPIGHFGVLIFFVHTSLVLMMSMDRMKLLGSRLYLSFYIRRFFRIYPLSIAVVLIMFSFHIPPRGWDPAVYTPISWPQLISNLALTMNLTYSHLVLVPLWSLPYEVQMYAVLPGLYLFFRKHCSFRAMVLGWVVSVILGFGVPHLVGRVDFVRYAPCYIGSIMAFHLKSKIQPFLPSWVFPLGIATLLGVYFQMDRSVGGWIPCLILALLIPLCREIESRVVVHVCSRVARYSYGIYLGHAPIMWFAFKAIKANPVFQSCLFLVLIVLMPMLMFHFLEAPMMRVGARLANALIAVCYTKGRLWRVA